MLSMCSRLVGRSEGALLASSIAGSKPRRYHVAASDAPMATAWLEACQPGSGYLSGPLRERLFQRGPSGLFSRPGRVPPPVKSSLFDDDGISVEERKTADDPYFVI